MTTRKSNIFEKIGALIPGYDGYANRLTMRQTDKKLRELCYSNIKQVEQKIDELQKQLISDGQYEQLGSTENLRKSLNTLASKILFAPYGESGFFGKEVIKEDELTQIHDFDEGLIERSELMKVIVLEHNQLPIYINAINLQVSNINEILLARNHFIQKFN
jgi:hypothetical protein